MVKVPSKALRWNKDVFGNVFTRKKIIMARLLGVQKALVSHPNPFLINLQNKLIMSITSLYNLKKNYGQRRPELIRSFMVNATQLIFICLLL